MNRRPNRVLLAFVGVLLLAVGVLGLLVAAGVLVLDQPADLYGELEASIATYPWVWAAAVLVGGLLLAVLGVVVIGKQLRVRPGGGGLSTTVLERDERGRTSLEPVAVAKCAAADLERVHGVVDSTVRLVTMGERPRLRVRLDVPPEGDVAQIRRAAEPAYRRVAQSLSVDSVHVDTRVRSASRGTPARVE